MMLMDFGFFGNSRYTYLTDKSSVFVQLILQGLQFPNKVLE